MLSPLQRIDHAERRHQLAGRVDGDLEFATGQRLDGLRQHLGTAEDRVQRARETGRQAPTHGGLRMHGGCYAGSQHTGHAGILDKGTTIH